MSYAEDALNSMHDEAMDLVEKSGGDVLVCENDQGMLLIVGRNGMTDDLLATIRQSLTVTIQ